MASASLQFSRPFFTPPNYQNTRSPLAYPFYTHPKPRSYVDVLLHGTPNPVYPQIPRPVSLLTYAWLDSRRQGNRCFRCGDLSHKMAACREPIHCFHCGFLGHRQHSCSRKPPSTRPPANLTAVHTQTRYVPSSPLPPRVNFLVQYLQLKKLILTICNQGLACPLIQNLETLLAAYHTATPLISKPSTYHKSSRSRKTNLTTTSSWQRSINNPIEVPAKERASPASDLHSQSPHPSKKRRAKVAKAKQFTLSLQNKFEALNSLLIEQAEDSHGAQADSYEQNGATFTIPYHPWSLWFASVLSTCRESSSSKAMSKKGKHKWFTPTSGTDGFNQEIIDSSKKYSVSALKLKSLSCIIGPDHQSKKQIRKMSASIELPGWTKILAMSQSFTSSTKNVKNFT